MTEEVKKKRTPKRKLKDISFDHEGAHLALVSDQLNGGPANLQPNALFLKAIDSYSDEILEKASQVTVTMPIEEFLEKFFDVEQDDAEILARALGYTTSMQDKIAAGEEPLELLEKIKHRVISVGASDRYLANGTIADLRAKEGGSAGYVSFFKHGVIGKGLNDYDAIFTTLKSVGFTGWVSIEDGVDGMGQMIESAKFLKAKINEIWG